MFRRTAAFLLLIWLFGFVWFAVTQPRPVAGGHTDVIVVLTGGPSRIDRGLEALRAKLAPQLLVSGVDREVRPSEFAAEYKVSPALMQCCVTLGYSAYDTRSNAIETAQWIDARKAKSVRLVTTDWHMRRAALELSRELPPDVTVLRDAVSSRPSFSTLFLEYHKLLARWAVDLWYRWHGGGK